MGLESLLPGPLEAIIRREPIEGLCWMMPTCYGEAPGALKHGVPGRQRLPGRPASCPCCMEAPGVLRAGGRLAAGLVAPEALLEPEGEGGARGAPGDACAWSAGKVRVLTWHLLEPEAGDGVARSVRSYG